MEYVGLDPQGAGELARRFDAAALDLETHASVVAQLLDQAGVLSAAPRQMREIAAWAAYRSRDLRKRIAAAIAADTGGLGRALPGFRFASRGSARQAGAEAVAKVREPLDGHHPNRLGEELAKAKAYLADPDYAAAFFKGLGPKGTFDLL